MLITRGIRSFEFKWLNIVRNSWNVKLFVRCYWIFIFASAIFGTRRKDNWPIKLRKRLDVISLHVTAHAPKIGSAHLATQPTVSSPGFPAKWRLTNEHRNSILMTCHNPDLGCDTSSVTVSTLHLEVLC